MPEQSGGAFSQATGRDLEGGADQPRYRRYQFDLIAPHCGRTVLEVGAGLGEFSAQFTGLDRLVLTDLDPDAVEVVRRRFADREEVRTAVLDAAALAADPSATARVPGTPVDSVVAINVLEHLTDDSGALAALARLVRPGGTIVLWVPGYQQLYGDFDRRVGHVQRYTPHTLTAAICGAGLEPELVHPVNLLGGIAWWVAVRRGGAGSPDPRLVAVYDRVVVPVTRVLERFVKVPFGQSVLAVARVPGAAGTP